jgi:hypothetical protein
MSSGSPGEYLPGQRLPPGCLRTFQLCLQLAQGKSAVQFYMRGCRPVSRGPHAGRSLAGYLPPVEPFYQRIPASQRAQRATQELLADYIVGELQLITGFLSHLEAAMADIAAGQSEPG